ncbi:MAG: HAD family hydrolase [Chloroflexota bacterium]
MSLISIDFHNTLFHCNEWFRLEIETLPAAFLRWRQTAGDPDVTEKTVRDAVAAYRAIRAGVMSSGEESDAVSSLRLVVDQLDIPAGDDEIERGVEELMRSALGSARPLDGARALIQHLVDAGHTLAVVSSAAYHPFLEWALAEHGLRDAFSAVVTSASCGIYKSNPAIYTHTLERLSAPADDAVHIGDSHRFDVTTARLAGMRTVLLADHRDLTLDPQPDAWIATLGEASAVLDTLPVHRRPNRSGS